MDYTHFIGVDPGFTGAIAVLNRAGTTCRVWPMPVTAGRGREARSREIDLFTLAMIMRQLRLLPSPHMTIEWPSTRPGEPPEPAERFGRGKGYLHGFAYLMNFSYSLCPPNLWKGKLALPGKWDDPNSKVTHAWWCRKYPAFRGFVTGPRGGVLDGPLDALCIAEYARIGETALLGWKGGRRQPTFKGANADDVAFP